jgi:hypothetical protein
MPRRPFKLGATDPVIIHSRHPRAWSWLERIAGDDGVTTRAVRSPARATAASDDLAIIRHEVQPVLQNIYRKPTVAYIQVALRRIAEYVESPEEAAWIPHLNTLDRPDRR